MIFFCTKESTLSFNARDTHFKGKENPIHKCVFMDTYCVNKHIHEKNSLSRLSFKYCIISNNND